MFMKARELFDTAKSKQRNKTGIDALTKNLTDAKSTIQSSNGQTAIAVKAETDLENFAKAVKKAAEIFKDGKSYSCKYTTPNGKK